MHVVARAKEIQEMHSPNAKDVMMVVSAHYSLAIQPHLELHFAEPVPKRSKKLRKGPII